MEPAKPYKIKMLLSYDGTGYFGWQRQKSTPATIQQTIETALSRIFACPVRICGSGRTDAGVHALNQVAHAWVPKKPSKFNLLHALNSLTPESVAFKEVCEVDHSFHAIASAIDKTYKYLLLVSPTPSALRARYCHWQRPPIDSQLLQQYSQILVGKQDFKSFQSTGSEAPSTVRQIFSASWRHTEPQLLEFSIRGDGFLKQMVRNIVGTQLDLALRGAPSEQFEKILQARDRQSAGPTAPAHGLYLCTVRYPSKLDNRCRKP